MGVTMDGVIGKVLTVAVVAVVVNAFRPSFGFTNILREEQCARRVTMIQILKSSRD